MPALARADADGRVAGPVETVKAWGPLGRFIRWSPAPTILTNGAFTDPEGERHQTVGLIALGLVFTRLAWGLIGPRYARFTAFPPLPGRALRHLKGIRAGHRGVHLGHSPLAALMVYNIWGTVLALAATGLMLGTPRSFGIGWVKALHEGLFDWLVLSVVLHLAGVVFDTWRTGVPLVRAMIDGRKREPEGREMQ